MRMERGRAEVLVGPCTALRIGDNSSFRLVSNQLTDARIDLVAGFAVMDAVAMAHDAKLTFAVNAALATITIAGFYYFDFAPALVKLFAGRARVSWAKQNVEVSAGKALRLDAGAFAGETDKNALNPLDNWSKARAKVLAAQRARHPIEAWKRLMLLRRPRRERRNGQAIATRPVLKLGLQTGSRLLRRFRIGPII
jgi:hypothetical protein